MLLWGPHTPPLLPPLFSATSVCEGVRHRLPVPSHLNVMSLYTIEMDGREGGRGEGERESEEGKGVWEREGEPK